jgi:hypothetical protein
MTVPENFTHEIKDLDLERLSDSVISPSRNGFFTKGVYAFILWPDAYNTNTLLKIYYFWPNQVLAGNGSDRGT